ncbi:DUF6518 family protein [Sanguibacter sp. 25GB23B1]|uniref:DUF6518 family protein n=1 Tax=unclassified Sanguibacter TaxID=2645534 RepID=UPI0032AEC4FE
MDESVVPEVSVQEPCVEKGAVPEPAVQRAGGRGRSAGATALIETAVAVAVVSLLLGAATFLAQGLLPDPLRPLANSASGWTLLTVLVVQLARARPLPSAVLGAVGFVALVLGYAIAADVRGLFYSPVLFGVVGILVGPFVGVATSWLRSTGWRAALGAGALAGVALGECVYGLVVVSDTTGWFYWVLIGVAGVALLGVTLVRRAGRGVVALGGVGVALAVAGAFFVAYSGLG